MCGIYGVLNLAGPSVRTEEVLSRMGETLHHRGPDDEGRLADGPLLFGMRRLSIIDVAGGHQPIAGEDGNAVTVCNGEIYNFRELRRELEGAGHRFATGSDTEVVVHAYEQFGLDFLRRLEGMFGLALWDRSRRRLILARDPLGIKPVYYWQSDRELAFASEAKALFRLAEIRPELDRRALAQFLSVGYTPGPHSLFKGIRKLGPGQLLLAENGRVEVRSYWDLASGTEDARTPEQWTDAVRSELERAVRDQMISDVPIGAFLSGGLDSSTVVALMARQTPQPVKTFAIGFRDSSGAALYNELPYARVVADACGTQHREILVQPDVAALLPKLVWHLDEPIADAAFITTYLVSKFAREEVTVILSGVGGDELFAGYRRYLDEHYRRSYRRIPGFLRRGFLAPLARRLPSDRHRRVLNELRLARAFILADALPFEERYRHYMQVFDRAEIASLLMAEAPEYDDCIRAAFAGSAASDPLRRLFDVDRKTQLPEDLLALTDRMSMAVSLECRVPLLDQRLVALTSRIPARVKLRDGELKHLMKRAVADLLPDEILRREKRGFGAPVGAWFRKELAPIVELLLSPQAVARRGLLDPATVALVIAEHGRSETDRTDHLLALVVLEIWCRLYLDGDDIGAVTDELKQSLAA